MSTSRPPRILFVCLGNICRSPTAEGVMRRLATQEAVELELDSAGTGGWHVGAPPDARATEAAAAQGITLSGTARQVTDADFEHFDLIIAMDGHNARELRHLAPDREAWAKIRLLREYDPTAESHDVADPYYGGEDGFKDVLAVIEAGCRGLISEVRPR